MPALPSACLCDWSCPTANCIIIAQILHFSLLFSGAVLQTAPAQSDFQSEIGAIIMQFAVFLWLTWLLTRAFGFGAQVGDDY